MRWTVDSEACGSRPNQEDEVFRNGGRFHGFDFGLLNACHLSQRNDELVHESTIGRIPEIPVSNTITPRRASHLWALDPASDQSAADGHAKGDRTPSSFDFGS